MSVWKCTMLIQVATNVSNPNAAARRIGGFSEGFYDIPVSESRVVTDFRTLCGLRAALLPIGAAIVGQRYQRIDSFAPSQSDGMVFPGSSGLKSDDPRSALYCKVRSGSRNFRPMYLRGLPDDMSVEGEYVGAGDWHTNLLAFGDYLDGYYFKGKNLAAGRIPVESVENTKLVTTVTPHGLAEGNLVKLANMDNREGGKISGSYLVKDAPTDKTFHIVTAHAFAADNGTAQNVTSTYIKIAPDAVTGGRVTKKPVGRPFTQFVGRHSKR